ncbi:MAG: glycine cleavage system aminomethyltransferase GcvT [Sedimentisphaerales bacterium]
MAEKMTAGAFVFESPASSPVGSVLYDEHLKLTDKSHIAEFAGYLMPLWYSSIAEEHSAVRQRAGIFDCTHMGALEVVGPNAESFLDAVTTNNVRTLQVGSAQYSYLLDAAGNVLDDIIIYRRDKEKFMVVVNASNEPKAKAYLAALQAGKTKIDLAKPDRKIKTAPVRDMRDTKTGPDCRVDIAIQGPSSPDVLCKLADASVGQQLKNLKSFTFCQAKLANIDCIISRTGYTGAKVCFELFVHPKDAANLWQKLIDAGALPCGLGARDSLRVEAGLPLYGHELDGPYNISPFEAGYGWAVKLDKDFFIGKAAMEKISKTCKMKVARLELSGEKGVRPVRQNDPVISDCVCVGWVLSSATAGSRQIAIVYMDKDKAVEGNSVDIYYLARSESQKNKGRKQAVQQGERINGDITGKVVSRFEKF